MQGRATAAHGDVGDHPRGDNSWQLVTPTSDLWYDVWLHVEAMWRAAIDMPAYKRTHELELTASGSPSDLLWSRYNRYWLLTFVATSQFPNTTDAGSDKHTESLNTNDGLLPNVLLAHFANSELNYLNSIPAVWNKIWNMQFADMNCRSALQWIAQQLETTQIKIDNFASNSPRMSLYVARGTKPTFKVTMAFDIESLYDLLFYITVSIYWNCSVLCRYAQIKCIISEAYYTYISHKKQDNKGSRKQLNAKTFRSHLCYTKSSEINNKMYAHRFRCSLNINFDVHETTRHTVMSLHNTLKRGTPRCCWLTGKSLTSSR